MNKLIFVSILPDGEVIIIPSDSVTIEDSLVDNSDLYDDFNFIIEYLEEDDD